MKIFCPYCKTPIFYIPESFSEDKTTVVTCANQHTVHDAYEDHKYGRAERLEVERTFCEKMFVVKSIAVDPKIEVSKLAFYEEEE